MSDQAIRQVFNEIKRDSRRAVIRSINRASKSTLNQILTKIYKKYNIKKSDLRGYFILERATASSGKALLKVRQDTIPLIEFSARQLKRGVKATVKRGERKLYRSEDGDRGSFIKGGQVRIRQTSESYPIRMLLGFDPGRVALSDEFFEEIQEYYETTFQKELYQNLDYYLNK